MKFNLNLNTIPLGLTEPLDLISASTSDSQNSLIANESQTFGNIQVSIKSLGNTNYRIEWFSKMTGATTSIVKLTSGSYAVFRKWAIQKRLPDVSQEFISRKTALVHFLNNVDIIRANDITMNAAKNYCLGIFSKQEGMAIPKDYKFARYRLQGAIGRGVQIRSKRDSENVIAEGILLQLVENKAEVQVANTANLINKKPVQKFNTQLVYVK